MSSCTIEVNIKLRDQTISMKLHRKTFAESINISKIAAWTIGIIIYNRGTQTSTLKRVLNMLHYRFCFYFFAAIAVAEIIDMVLVFRVNFLAVTHVLPCICYCLVSLCKFGSMALSLETSRKLLYDLEDLWCGEELKEVEMNMMLESTGKGRRFQLILAYLTGSCGFTFGLSSIIKLLVEYFKSGEIVKGLPYLIYIPWDTTGPISYPLGYLIHAVSSYIGFVGVIASDTFFIATIVHISTQFKLLQLRILCIIEEAVPTELRENLEINHNYHLNMNDALIRCAKRHSELIALSNKLEEIFSPSILLNFINSSIIICCSGFNLLAVTGIDLAIFITFLLQGLYQIYTLSWAGNQLIDTSTEIGDAAYNSSWYLTDKRFRQMIHIIMQRSQRPQMVTALNFSVLSFRTFSSILSSSYSYFTLLKTSYKK